MIESNLFRARAVSARPPSLTVALPLALPLALALALPLALAGCSDTDAAPSESTEADFTGYETVEGFSNEPFRKSFAPALLIADQEMRIRQGRGSLIIGARTPDGMCVISNDLGSRLTKSRDYVFPAGHVFAIEWRDIQFTRLVELGQEPVPTVRVRLREYDAQGRRAADFTKFSLYCYNSEFDPARKMPTADDVVAILRQGMLGTFFRFVPSSQRP